MRAILVVGASGFLGSHIVEELAPHYRVVACCRPSSSNSRLCRISHSIEVVRCSIEEIPNFVSRVHADVVINAAVAYGREESIAETLDTNAVLPLRLAESLLGTPDALFIHADSFFSKNAQSCEYLRVYRETKRAAVALLSKMETHVKVVNMRLEHLYGTSDSPTKFVSSILKQIVSGASPIALTSGTQLRDFIHVRDAARAFRAVVDRGSSVSQGFVSFDVGTGLATSIRELVEEIKLLSGSESDLNFEQLPDRLDEMPCSVADVEPLVRLGWAPQVSLREGLRELIEQEKSEQQRFV